MTSESKMIVKDIGSPHTLHIWEKMLFLGYVSENMHIGVASGCLTNFYFQ